MANAIQLYSLTEGVDFVCCHFYCLTDYQTVQFPASAPNCYWCMMLQMIHCTSYSALVIMNVLNPVMLQTASIMQPLMNMVMIVCDAYNVRNHLTI
jgi:hypothetical protein